MRYSQKALATVTIKEPDGTIRCQPKVVYRERDGRWFFATGAKPRGCSVQYINGNPNQGFTL